MDRNNRQKLIPDWNQRVLDNAQVVVLGADQLSNCIGAGCGGLTVGKLIIVGDGVVNKNGIDRASDGFLLFEAENGESKAKAIAKLIKKINPGMAVVGIDALPGKAALSYIRRPDILIDATNNPTSKYFSYEYHKKQNVPLISASTSETKCSIRIFRNTAGKTLEEKLMHAVSEVAVAESMPRIYESMPQGNAMSGLAAGVVLGEMRHILMPLKGDGRSVTEINYDCLSDDRLGLGGPAQKAHNRFDGKTILLIGAGAIGNYAGLWSSLTGARVVIADGDVVDSTNLNRQILYYGSVDRPKASSLAGMLGKITKRQVGYSIGFVDDRCYDLLNRVDPDLVIACVDRDEVRVMINNLVINSGTGIPIIDTASAVSGGEAYFALQKQTTCIRHQKWGFGTDKILMEKIKEDRAIAEERRKKNERGGCVFLGDPSVIMPNLAAGSFALVEGAHILAKSDRFVKGYVKYAPWQVDRLEYCELDYSKSKDCYSNNCVLSIDKL